jgi:hypothetical protein
MDFLYYRRPVILSSDSDNMDWVEDWIDLAHRGIDLEIALRENKNPADAHSAYMQTLIELKSLDTGRQFGRRHHRNTGSASSGIDKRLIKRGSIS